MRTTAYPRVLSIAPRTLAIGRFSCKRRQPSRALVWSDSVRTVFNAIGDARPSRPGWMPTQVQVSTSSTAWTRTPFHNIALKAVFFPNTFYCSTNPAFAIVWLLILVDRDKAGDWSLNKRIAYNPHTENNSAGCIIKKGAFMYHFHSLLCSCGYFCCSRLFKLLNLNYDEAPPTTHRSREIPRALNPHY